MLIDDVRMRDLLSRIACRLTGDAALRQDLMQEALVHLWLLEARKPRQSRSWYLQSCKFHLQNYLVAGRSVDSLKRKRAQFCVSGDGAELDEKYPASDHDGAAFAVISARDILDLLCGRLTPFEQAVLYRLAEGRGAREIACDLKVSHPTIIKHRRKIAALAIRLGIAPLPKYSRSQAIAAIVGGNGR
jgi:DNA-directed RNA polymerase specialized sigma24 family protein